MDWCRRALGAALLVIASVAHAQPGVTDPPPPEPPPSAPVETIPVEELPTQPQYSPPSSEPPPPAPYPRGAAARPLLLPTGGVEGTVNLRAEVMRKNNSDSAAETSTLGSAAASARYSLGLVELELGTTIHLFADDGENGGENGGIMYERLESLYAQGRFAVARELVLGAQLAVARPLSDIGTGVAASGFLQHKLHFTEASALELTGMLGYDRQLDDYDLDADGSSDTISDLFAVARVRLQLQVAPLVTLEAIANYTVTDYRYDGAPDTIVSQQYGVGAIISLTPDLDLNVGAEILTAQDPVCLFTLGLTGRRIP